MGKFVQWQDKRLWSSLQEFDSLTSPKNKHLRFKKSIGKGNNKSYWKCLRWKIYFMLQGYMMWCRGEKPVV